MTAATGNAIDRMHLRHAARLALRGQGGAEPNPLVGCVIVSETGKVVGWGYHRTCGEAHAEIRALNMAGDHTRGATAYITLEPCNHTGRTGPCSEALIQARVSRVVVGRRDPHPEAGGGIERLLTAGVQVDCLDDDPFVTSITDPFVRRVTTGLPWVTVKWAQTVDGRIATRTGASQWISNEASRRLVHRQRGKVDVILTGIGTVLADDPLLTARDVRVRRIARRVVIDPELQIPLESRLVATAGDVPTLIACDESMFQTPSEKVSQLTGAGVELMGLPLDDGDLPLKPILSELVKRHEATHVLVESGPGLAGRLFRQKLVSAAWVFIAPKVMGDEQALPGVRGLHVPMLADAVSLELRHSRRRNDDIVLHYRTEEC